MLRAASHSLRRRIGSRTLACALGATCAGCFNPTSYDGTSGPSSLSDPSSGTAAETTSSTTAPSSTSTTSGTGTTTAPAGTSGDMTTSCGQCCGDGVLTPPEECDDGNVANDDGCSADCHKEWRWVFVTSETFPADLGGSQGADEKCQQAASAAGLSGTYRAWLSTSTQQPLDVLAQSLVPYRRPDGMQVAKNWPDLLDGALENPINVTEIKTFVPGPVCDSRAVWTASFNNGVEYDAAAKSCSDWQDTSGTTTGGNPNVTDVWSNGCPLSCGIEASLYCFEQ